MAVKVGINGFGRIGRCFLRGLKEEDGLDVVAINDITNPQTLTHLFKYDSVHGVFPGKAEVTEKGISVDGKEIAIYACKDPAELPWKELGVDVVVESTGLFRDRDGAGKHLSAGAKKVVISAPGKDIDLTVAMGINMEMYDPEKHHLISGASCTTNCLAPVVKVLLEKFGIEKGLMTTIHSYTNGQRILDTPHKDLRRARAAAMSMIPTTTGAAKAVSLVLPAVKGKLDGGAIRVPTPNVSLVDLTVILSKDTTTEELNAAMEEYANGQLKGILGYCPEPLVSIDFMGSNYSSIFDALSTTVLGGNFAKVMSWYDNEWGYAMRLKDVSKYVAQRL